MATLSTTTSFFLLLCLPLVSFCALPKKKTRFWFALLMIESDEIERWTSGKCGKRSCFLSAIADDDFNWNAWIQPLNILIQTPHSHPHLNQQQQKFDFMLIKTKVSLHLLLRFNATFIIQRNTKKSHLARIIFVHFSLPPPPRHAALPLKTLYTIKREKCLNPQRVKGFSAQIRYSIVVVVDFSVVNCSFLFLAFIPERLFLKV